MPWHRKIKSASGDSRRHCHSELPGMPSGQPKAETCSLGKRRKGGRPQTCADPPRNGRKRVQGLHSMPRSRKAEAIPCKPCQISSGKLHRMPPARLRQPVAVNSGTSAGLHPCHGCETHLTLRACRIGFLLRRSSSSLPVAASLLHASWGETQTEAKMTGWNTGSVSRVGSIQTLA